MPEKRFLNDIMHRIVSGVWRVATEAPDGDIVQRCHALLHEKSEAAGLVAAHEILAQLERMGADELVDVFERVSREFSIDDEALKEAMDRWTPGDIVAARRIHFLAEPESQKLMRALNRVPGATARLVALRARLLDAPARSEILKSLDEDFQHLFASWFNRGFLEIRRIDWSTPADVLEKIIANEAVHAIAGWDDLRQRVGEQDRRLFAFFHPAMPFEPLIFVEVALTDDIPSDIASILSRERRVLDSNDATTAVFYSISNCQKGLRGISFGNFLIKQVVVELERELPRLDTFVTLSPVPGLRAWAEAGDKVQPADRGPDAETARRIAAQYLMRAKRNNGLARDTVANFHLGNGATLYQVHARANESARALGESWGVMVNYLYDQARIEANHQSYSTRQIVSASLEVVDLAGTT